MAQRTVVEVTDDLDGSILTEFETVQFAVDGNHYEFDTSPQRAAQFREGVARYLAVSRPARPEQDGYQRSRIAVSAPAHVVRQWAEQNGYPVSPKGRITLDIRRAFDAAH